VVGQVVRHRHRTELELAVVEQRARLSLKHIVLVVVEERIRVMGLVVTRIRVPWEHVVIA